MKHPENNCEPFEFNIGQALALRCVQDNSSPTVCGECEACQIITQLNNAKAWFQRFGTQSKNRFLQGLLCRFRSVHLLEYVVHLLHPLVCKDYTYARSRTKPSQTVDQPVISGDHALDVLDIDIEMRDIFHWFQNSNYWTKANFMLGILKCCDTPQLFNVAMLARTLLSSESSVHSTINVGTYTEAESIPSSRYTYDSADHPEHELLRLASPLYSKNSNYPTSEFSDVEREIINDDNDEILTIDFDDFMYDPASMVIPRSAKASAGVAKNKDFIRSLPVHLSKYILSFLDPGNLHNCICVSQFWRVVVEEVYKEYHVNQQLWEDVMLMQGAAAQGVNPTYANDTDVPVPNLIPGSMEVIKTTDHIIETAFKSEANFETAYSGISKRQVIMEERNVYCGAYNIMVVTNNEDSNRVFHTDGGNLIAIGSNDRKVRFLDSITGKTVGPTVHGHAGSVKSVYLCEKKGFLLSGSYDTSIRCWDINTGHCMKILRGHQGTVSCLSMYKDFVVSGSKDCTCKVWDLNTGKALRTFRHKVAVSAVAIGELISVTGCEAGKVKVWDMKNGELIKVLSGHHRPVTCIKFDMWHIVTGSKDNYVMVWSAQGEHARCLNALRHQKEVLCLEFMYLRVVSGSADGRLRIWNIITGQCCRIMRGNSRSDPILGLVAIDNRITLNTNVNLLTLNFEEVDWDYTLESDKMPPLVRYGSYSDAPVRHLPYSYVRAQRMRQDGAANTKITRHNKNDDAYLSLTHTPRARQLPHSAKSLSVKNMMRSRLIQQRSQSAKERKAETFDRTAEKPGSVTSSKPPVPATSPSRMTTAKSKTYSVSIVAPSEHEEMQLPPQRRISWAFEKPLIPKCKAVSMSETKAVLRSQIRAKEIIPPPDFIYLAVNNIQNAQKHSDSAKNTDYNQRDLLANKTFKLRDRPPSAPAVLDTRTKIPRGEINLDDFRSQLDEDDLFTDVASVVSRPKSFVRPETPVMPVMETLTTDFEVLPVASSHNHKSIHPERVKSSIPKGRIIRPHTANVARLKHAQDEIKNKKPRPQTAVGLTRPVSSASFLRPGTSMSLHTAASSSSINVQTRKKQAAVPLATNAVMVPMLMYPPNMLEKIKEKVTSLQISQRSISRSSSEPVLLGVNQFNDPMRSQAQFKLRTYEQEKQYLHDIANLYRQQRKHKVTEAEQAKRRAWLLKAKGKNQVQVVSAVT